MGVSLLDIKDFALNIEDITNIVNALDVYVSYERNLAISENRDFNLGIQSTFSYLRDFENVLKRSEVKYVKLSYSI